MARKIGAIIVILATLLIGMAAKPASTKAAEPTQSIGPTFAWCDTGTLQTQVRFSPKGVFSFTDGALKDMKRTGAQECQIFFGGAQVTYSFNADSQITLFPQGITIRGGIITTGYLHFSLPPGDYSNFNLTVLVVADYVDPTTPISPSAPAIYFTATGHNLVAPFDKYWAEHGLDMGDPGVSLREALALWGAPLTEQIWENVNGEGMFKVQYFERGRLEWHPENLDPQFQVLGGQLGRTVAQMRVVSIAPTAVGKDHTCVYDTTTGHNLCGTFQDFWRANGGLAQFGYPLTDQITEQLENGKTYQVQYFERTRLELHPENAGTPYEIQLGQFGPPIMQAMLALRQIDPTK
jgi:hypothetical protein